MCLRCLKILLKLIISTMLASLCPCCFKRPTEPYQDNQQSDRTTRLDNTNKNSGQNRENSNNVLDQGSHQQQGRRDEKVTEKGPDSAPNTAITKQADKQHNLVKQVNGNGNLIKKGPDPPVEANSHPEAVSKENDKRMDPQAKIGSGSREMRPPDPPKIPVSSPKRSEPFSTEQEKGDFEREVNSNQSQRKKTLDKTAEQKVLLFGEGTQKDVVKSETRGINTVDQNTESRIPPKITQGGGGQAPQEQQKVGHIKQENNDANQRDTRLDSSSISMSIIGQRGKPKGVQLEDTRKDDKNTTKIESNSTGKTMNSIEHTTKEQKKGTQKQDDNNKGQIS